MRGFTQELSRSADRARGCYGWAMQTAIDPVHLAPVLPAWAVLAGTAERALRRSRGPQRREPSALEWLLGVVAVLGGAAHA